MRTDTETKGVVMFISSQVGSRRSKHPFGRARRVALGLLGATLTWTALVPIQGTGVGAESPSSESEVVSLVPARVLETRSGAGARTVDGVSQGLGRVAAGSTVEVKVTGRGGVPADATAVMLNVTAVGPDRAGYATVFPCGSEVPGASNLNFRSGEVVPNAVLSAVGAGGKVCIFTTASTHLIADVNAAFATPTGTPDDEGSVGIGASGSGISGSTDTGDLPLGITVPVEGAPIPAGTTSDVPDVGEDHPANLDEQFELGVREQDSILDGALYFKGERFLGIDEAYYAGSVSTAIGRLVMWRRIDGVWYRWSSCSGTVVGRTMVLTADHCLRTRDGKAYDAYTFVPGLRGSSEPVGEWVAAGSRAYFPTEQNHFRQTSLMTLFDYAIIKFDPTYNGGKSIGDYTGSFPIYQGASAVATKVTVGYPVEGYYNYSNGGWCDTRSNWCYPYVCRSSDDATVELGSGWRLMGYGCNANGGISGGGIFGQINGRWYVISVNSIGGFIMDRNNNLCSERARCSWYMRNLWGTEFKSGYFDKFYYAVAAA